MGTTGNACGNNVIYFDQHYNESSDKDTEIFKDTELFKFHTNGAFILATSIKKLKMVLIQLLEYHTECKFDLITTGSSSQEVMNLSNFNYFSFSIKRVCLFTYHPEQHQNMIENYKIIKGIFYTQSEVINFLKEGEYSTRKFTTLQLITLEDYESKYSCFHKILAQYYGNNSISDYNKAIQKAKFFMKNQGNYKLQIIPNKGETKEKSMLNALSLFNDIENNYELIINNYTKEIGSIYKDFNYLLLRVIKDGIEGFGWFMAGLMYSLDKYAKTANKGLKTNQYLYRGMTLDIIEVLNYERMVDSIITFPSFISTALITDKPSIVSLIKKVASNSQSSSVIIKEDDPLIVPETFSGRYIKVEERVKNGKFSVMFTLHYRNNKDLLYNTVNISDISEYNNEKECLFLPFSFYKVLDVKIDLNCYEADIELDCYSRNKIIEQKIKEGKSLEFSEDLVLLKDIILATKFKPYSVKKQ